MTTPVFTAHTSGPVRRGCDCKHCAGVRASQNHMARLRYKQRAMGRYEPFLVDATPAREHVAAIRAQGRIGEATLAKLTGVDARTVARLWRPLNGGRRPAAEKLERDVSERILAFRLDLADPGLGLPDPVTIDGTRSRLVLQACAVLGYSLKEIAVRLGLAPNTPRDLVRCPEKLLTAGTARAYDRLFRELRELPEPAGYIAERTRNAALAKGWVRLEDSDPNEDQHLPEPEDDSEYIDQAKVDQVLSTRGPAVYADLTRAELRVFWRSAHLRGLGGAEAGPLFGISKSTATAGLKRAARQLEAEREERRAAHREAIRRAAEQDGEAAA